MFEACSQVAFRLVKPAGGYEEFSGGEQSRAGKPDGTSFQGERGALLGEPRSSVGISLTEGRHGQNKQHKTLVSRVRILPRDFERLGCKRDRALDVALVKVRVGNESDDMSDLIFFACSPKQLKRADEVGLGQVVMPGQVES